MNPTPCVTLAPPVTPLTERHCGEATNGGVALAGVIVGVLAVIASLIFAAFWVGLFNEVGAGDYLDCLQQAGQDRTLVQECSDRFQESVESKFSITPTP